MDTKINKALLATLLALIIISLGCVGSVAAAEQVIKAAKIEGRSGSKVVLAITAENLKGSEGGQFNLTFDQSLVRPVSIEPGDLVLSAGSNLHMANLEYAPGELIFMWVTVSADTKNNGVVCLITFDLLKEGTAAIEFKDLIVVDGNGRTPKTIAGHIKVGPESSGPGEETSPEQDSGSDQEDSSIENEGDEEELIVEEILEEEDELNLNEKRLGFNPLLVLTPTIIIVVLAAFYILVKKRGSNN